MLGGGGSALRGMCMQSRHRRGPLGGAFGSPQQRSGSGTITRRRYLVGWRLVVLLIVWCVVAVAVVGVLAIINSRYRPCVRPNGCTSAGTGAKLPSYATSEQARAIINAAETTSDRLLLECFWQTSGRVSEVLPLRPCDVNRREGALILTNFTQRAPALRQKTVYVSPELARDLTIYAVVSAAVVSQVNWPRSAGHPIGHRLPAPWSAGALDAAALRCADTARESALRR
jgi:integrase